MDNTLQDSKSGDLPSPKLHSTERSNVTQTSTWASWGWAALSTARVATNVAARATVAAASIIADATTSSAAEPGPCGYIAVGKAVLDSTGALQALSAEEEEQHAFSTGFGASTVHRAIVQSTGSSMATMRPDCGPNSAISIANLLSTIFGGGVRMINTKGEVFELPGQPIAADPRTVTLALSPKHIEYLGLSNDRVEAISWPKFGAEQDELARPIAPPTDYGDTLADIWKWTRRSQIWDYYSVPWPNHPPCAHRHHSVSACPGYLEMDAFYTRRDAQVLARDAEFAEIERLLPVARSVFIDLLALRLPNRVRAVEADAHNARMHASNGNSSSAAEAAAAVACVRCGVFGGHVASCTAGAPSALSQYRQDFANCAPRL